MDKRKEELKDLYSNLKEAEKEGINPPHYDIQSEDIDFRELICKFGEVTNQDSPDGIIPLGNAVYMVEHFQTSAYPNNILQKRMKQNYDRAKKSMKKGCTEMATYLFPDLAKWQNEFAEKLHHHMEQLCKYKEKTCKKYPGKEQKFILVIEDISELIISEMEYTILEIEEFAHEILDYPEIDGVILCTHSSRGYQVVAIEEEKLKTNIKTNIENCQDEIIMFVGTVITKLLPEQRDTLINKMFSVLYTENMMSDESVFVERKP